MEKKLVMGGLFCVMLTGCIIAARGRSGPPPRTVIVAEPRLVFIAEAGIYYAPDVEFDLFFYGGRWYRWYGRAWYIATVHSGPWTVIVEPPEVFYRIPPGHAKHHIVKTRKAPPPVREREPVGPRKEREEVGPRREREEAVPRKEREDVGPRKEKEEVEPRKSR